ncbi:g-type lectin s-receptor-like serine/threonine-protein kinase [Quercus suber]|uniref:G-type lectin s-receptor-like serine/threonine-protein kinase n=1 Tax=Quercus suber TaxID=58331 RepID=A0AAW0IXY1_QUESU
MEGTITIIKGMSTNCMLTSLFILYIPDNETSLWESFENPTDTFLPGMSMSAFDRCNSYFDNARLVMNFSGMIELWEQKNRTWSLIEAESRHSCGVYNFCGKFSSCNPNNKLACKCLPGFMPDVPEKWHSGDFSNGCEREKIHARMPIVIVQGRLQSADVRIDEPVICTGP